ncbi:MAG TPA: hypothetical protein VHC97_01525 [Thermoanaerobaculia bacterium]|jgi:hypothetical protein|nr:hypothetical protein [Thermoanaerobaculia bacterium]
MKRFFLRGTIAAVLALSTLTAAYAAPKPVSKERPGFLAAAWSWIALRAFPARPAQTPRMEKEGCEMDPNGQKLVCAPVLAPALSDEGCDIDPNGSR